MPEKIKKPKDRGFFDKITNSFFLVVDAVFDFLEKRHWNVPIETRFFFHTAIYLAIFFLAGSFILDNFYWLEALLVILIIVTFCVANIRPIRQLLGYYTSDEKIHSIVNKIDNNQISIKEVINHLNKNLLPPHLTMSILRGYKRRADGLPPQLIKSLLRQPKNIQIVEEITLEELNDNDFHFLMQQYKNMLPQKILLKVIKRQKLNETKIKAILFFQENSYDLVKDLAASTTEKELIDFLVFEKARFDKKTSLKNFLRNRQKSISISLGLIVALIIFLPTYLFFFYWAILAAIIVWIVVSQYFYSFLIGKLYFRI
jgi:hypothetical protein